MLLCSNYNGWLAVKFGGLLLSGVAASCIIGLRQSGGFKQRPTSNSNHPLKPTKPSYYPCSIPSLNLLWDFHWLTIRCGKTSARNSRWYKLPLRAKKCRGYKATQLMVSPLPSHVLVVGALIWQWPLPVSSCRPWTSWGTKKKKRWIRAHEILIGSLGPTEFATRMLVRKMNSRKPPLSPIAEAQIQSNWNILGLGWSKGFMGGICILQALYNDGGWQGSFIKMWSNYDIFTC